MNPIIPARWNVLESEREFNADYFSDSPYASSNFRLTTIVLCVDLGLGISIAVGFWAQMPGFMRVLYCVFLLGMPIVWLRMRLDHRKMAAWRSTAPTDAANAYPVRMASHLITFAPYYLYLLVLILLLCLWAALRIRTLGG